MATVVQNHVLVNDVAKQMQGKDAIKITDTTSLADFGKVVISSATNIDLFYKAMVDRLARVEIGIRVYNALNRKMRRNNLEWGMFVEKLRVKTVDRASDNEALAVDSMQHSPYDVEKSSEIIAQIYGKFIGTWSIKDVLPGQTQLFTAFTSFEEFDKLIATIRLEIQNEIQTEMEALDNIAIATLIAYTFKKGKATQKINVVKRYNEEFHANLSNETCRHNADYLKYRVQLMNNTKAFMRVRSVLFNSIEDYSSFTNDEDLIVEVLAEAESDILTYMTSDTYHDSIMTLPGHVSIPCWQGLGNDNSYESHAKVMIKHDDADGEDVTVKNVIAVMRDYEAAGTYFDKQREWSHYNDVDDVTPFGIQFIKNYAIDPYENCVIFYDDADEV